MRRQISPLLQSVERQYLNTQPALRSPPASTWFRARCQQSGSMSRLSRCDAKSSESGPAASPSKLTTRGMTMLATAERLEEARSTQSLTSRYESLIRLAEAIRSHRDEKDLFQLLVDELRQVVPFDVMAQCDHDGNKVHWHFSEAYDSEKHVADIPREETVP